MFRQEFKFFIKQEDTYNLFNELKSILFIDKHCKNFNPYTITSIYFDNEKDSDLFDKLNGVRFREKYRIRYYNQNTNAVKFEIKRKHENVIEKQTINLNQEEFYKILNQDFSILRNNNQFEYLSYKLKYKLYKPKIVVKYDRLAFQLPINNLRVTLDLNLRSSTYTTNKGEIDSMSGKKIMPIGYEILELKYAQFTPIFLRNILSKYSLKRSSISKYTSSRLFNDVELNNDKPELPF